MCCTTNNTPLPAMTVFCRYNVQASNALLVLAAAIATVECAAVISTFCCLLRSDPHIEHILVF
jgi:hypothetical protein